MGSRVPSATARFPRSARVAERAPARYTRSMADLPSHPGVEILSDETAWSGRFRVDIVRFRHRRFDGTMSGIRTWELCVRGRAAALLPYDPWTDQVVLIEQFRLPALAAGVDPVMTEIPAGLCDPGEDAGDDGGARDAGGDGPARRPAAPRIGDFVLTPGGSDERCTMLAGRVRAPASGPDGIAGTAAWGRSRRTSASACWPAERGHRGGGGRALPQLRHHDRAAVAGGEAGLAARASGAAHDGAPVPGRQHAAPGRGGRARRRTSPASCWTAPCSTPAAAASPATAACCAGRAGRPP